MSHSDSRGVSASMMQSTGMRCFIPLASLLCSLDRRAAHATAYQEQLKHETSHFFSKTCASSAPAFSQPCPNHQTILIQQQQPPPLHGEQSPKTAAAACCNALNRSPTLRSAAPSRAPLRYIAPFEVENMHLALSRRCNSCSTSCRTTLATLVAPHKPSPRAPCTASTARFWPPLPCAPWAIPRSSRFWTRSRTTGTHWQFSSRGTASALAVLPSQTFRA